MEGKKPAGAGSSSAHDLYLEREELYGRREVNPSSSSEIIRSVFREPSKGVGKDSSTSDLFGSLRKQGSDGQAWNGQSKTSDGSPSKGHGMPSKDKNSGNHGEMIDTWNLSSSLYYGGQDICSNYSSSQSSGTKYTHKKDGEDDDMASRGNWWQGSLYY